MTRILGGALGLSALKRLSASVPHGRCFAHDVLQRMGINVNASDFELQHIPRSGATLVVANHPHGILDGAVLARVLCGIRPDIKFVANELLTIVPGVRELIAPVDVLGRPGGRNDRGLREAIRHLESGGMLVIFPAGEVAHRSWLDWSVREGEWHHMAARLAARCAVVPAWIDGKNSEAFQLLGLLHPRLRTALLAREFLAKAGSTVRVRFGAAIHGKTTTASLRERAESLPHSAPPELLDADVQRLPPTAELARSGDLRALLARAEQIPNVLHEIGRLREITFHEAGEGTGKALDLDNFDKTYDHLFLWNSERREIAGAYRLRRTADAQPGDLYTARLFGYGGKFLRELGPAIELGRSFVRSEYQREYAPLFLLWKGIGRYILQHPECRKLYGAVSISNTCSAAERQGIASYLQTLPAPERLRQELPRLMPPIDPGEHSRGACRTMPVLLRQYLTLGARLLSLQVDPEFSNALDALMVVDLSGTEPRLLRRYLGEAGAALFGRPASFRQAA